MEEHITIDRLPEFQCVKCSKHVEFSFAILQIEMKRQPKCDKCFNLSDLALSNPEIKK